MAFTARYGYVGFAVEQKDFVAEGVNEAGLSAGLFYFPNYGQYEAYDERRKNSSIADLQLVSLILGECATLDEVKEKVNETHVIAIDPRASTVHWRFTDAEGKQLVLEIVGGKANFYENPLGVLTNSPGLEWQLTNLNNYVNLFPGSAPAQTLGSAKLASFGAGSGFLGIPGDVTPPSRFVTPASHRGENRAAGLPDIEQFRHTCRHRIRGGEDTRGYSQCHSMDFGYGHEAPRHLFPHDVQQRDTQYPPFRHRFLESRLPSRSPG